MSTALYKALNDNTRRIILDELMERDGQTLFEICGRLTLNHGITSSRQATSQHLAVLEEAGLIFTERDGRKKHHYLDISPLEEIQRRWLLPWPEGAAPDIPTPDTDSGA